jgi:uncharacterized SAM-binding protein YcdF (DUF218 family)
VTEEAQAPRWRRWLKRVAALALGVLLIGLVAARPVARWIPQTLIERSAPARADALVVLAGDHRGERIDFAARLWEAGHVPEGPFLVSGGQIYGETTWAELMRARAEERGIPAGRIRLQAKSTTTAEDARFSAEVLGLPPGSRLILVTSPWHSERAAEHFREALGEGVEVLSCPSPEREGDWWNDAEDARDLATELLKRLWWGEGG